LNRWFLHTECRMVRSGSVRKWDSTGDSMVDV